RRGPSSWCTPPSGPGASRGFVLLRQVRAGSLGTAGNRRSDGRVGAGPLFVTGGAVLGIGGATVGAAGAALGVGGAVRTGVMASAKDTEADGAGGSADCRSQTEKGA